MNLLLLPSIFACVTCCVLAVGILTRGSRQTADRLAASIMIAAAFWALCEILWNTATDESMVLWLIRISAIGWMPIGGITLHFFLVLTGHPLHRNRAFVGALHGISAALVSITIATPWVDIAAVRTSWGWSYEVGPVFAVAVAYLSITFFAGIWLGVKSFRSVLSPSENRQAHLVLAAMIVCMTIASITDGLMPGLGYHMPRLGVLSVTLFGVIVAWGFQRYGYSLLAPGVFASEILATLPDGVALLRLDGTVRFANAGMLRLADTDASSLEGQPIAHLISEVRGRTGETIVDRECSLRADSGELIPVSISTSVLSDKRGDAIGLVLVARDLREVANLRRRLVVADRLAAVGQLAAGIAHEINNPVAYIRSNLGSLADLLEDIEKRITPEVARELELPLADGSELIGESLDGIDRVASIVRDVKGFSHTSETAPETVAINPLIESVLRVAAPQLPANCRVERNLGEIPSVLGAPQELIQVFLNLVVNAAQAIREGGLIRVSSSAEGDRVVVTVEDDGCGIAADQLERVFDPFFTTKAVGEGTGLGLAISYQIVSNHGGSIIVDSEVGRGTRFRVELPARGAAD